MSSLAQLQHWMADAVMQPLAPDDSMRRTVAGRSLSREADRLIRPNDRLSSIERVEIYSKSYWFRVLDCFAEDFPGLRLVLGEPAFWKLARDYISQCPSHSFTLRNLGSDLLPWLRKKTNAARFSRKTRELALDMTALEWAHIEAFDAADFPVLDASSALDGAATFRLQPHIRLLKLRYPLDDLLLTVRRNHNRRMPAARRQKLLKELSREAAHIAVHRAEFSVHYKRLEPEAYILLQRLQSGAPLGEAIEAAFTGSAEPETAAQRLQTWFAHWMELGWFIKKI